ncbi:sigma-70 family RNA polymerase sigma factor [Streptomyces justiciae]|uniref:sigma-70 family RNA polymerase sigma factor n=1 Tax=Streptomyces justiciae TaxID=2780140 RepID=UPI001880E639|nr:sigma-70 family RNA polymerase sigma factor [Streptomyces justiciae]MBE8476597.1 sigma-70 family RNA polymerase sigma factor [Streptomyces justiciae]MCW8380890.1 sigma-70 family RNA polymerase sigma factor [Streptomyces justiciae]
MGATTDRDEFVRLTDPYRRELLAHCYRMVGSADEAEDLVQETYLRAWRSYDGYEGRASLRTWLHRIATNTCLTALESRTRRPLPTGLGGPAEAPEEPLRAPATDVPWLQPLPDALLDPATVVAARGSLRLALVAALQHLPARQRAVLILRDVLAWRAPEVAALLDTSTAAVKSSLQRARARLDEVAPDEDLVEEPDGAADREVLDRYMAAFENADMEALLALLRDGVELEMPPHLEWFRGQKDVLRFLEARARAKRGLRMVPTRANGQPAAAMYERGTDGVLRAHSVQVLTRRGREIGRITVFLDPALFAVFGLPEVLS